MRAIFYFLFLAASSLQAAAPVLRLDWNTAGPLTTVTDSMGNYTITVGGSLTTTNSPTPYYGNLFWVSNLDDTNTLTTDTAFGTAFNAAAATGVSFAMLLIPPNPLAASGHVTQANDTSHYGPQVLSTGAVRINNNVGSVLDTATGLVTALTPVIVGFSTKSTERNIWVVAPGAVPITTPQAHDTTNGEWNNGAYDIGRYPVPGFSVSGMKVGRVWYWTSFETSWPPATDTPGSTPSYTASPTATTTRTPTPTSTVTPTSTYTPSPRRSLQLKHYSKQGNTVAYAPVTMAIFGHSYYWGYPVTDSFKAALQSYYIRHGRSICFVGQTTRGTISCPYTDGINGAKMADIDAVIDTDLALDIAAPTSNTFILIGGTEHNDKVANTDLTAFQSSTTSVLNKAHTFAVSGASVAPVYFVTNPQAPNPADISAYVAKEKIAVAAAQAAGQLVYLIDWNSQTDVDWYVDAIHPSAAGFVQMGDFIGKGITP